MNALYERDLAGEATEREAYLERLRADISADEVDDDDNLDWEAQYKRQRNESRGRLGLPRIV